MRLFLLPISTRRTLIYCETLTSKPASSLTLLDKLTLKASSTWVAWEKDTAAIWAWKKKVTFYGNQAMKRIPYEEWGLKTIPALTDKRKKAITDGTEKYTVLFPGKYLHQDKVPEIIRKLATERQAMHRSKLIWSIIGMPFTAPFMLVPVIPNLPFFYLVYRAYSHWKALLGSRHLSFLLTHSLPTPTPNTRLDDLYTLGLMYPTRAISRLAPRPTPDQTTSVSRVVTQQTNNGAEDVMVLQRWNGKLIAEEFHLPDMEIEIERAVEQVEDSIKAKDELVEEKLELEKATGRKPGERAVDALPVEVLRPLEEAEKVIHVKAEKVGREGREDRK